jgi:hypothetical protein
MDGFQEIKEKIFIKRFIIFFIILFMIIITIMGASALNVDNDDYFVMKPGEEMTGHFIITGLKLDGVARVGEGFVSFAGKQSFDLEKATGISQDAILVEYNIKIPPDQELDNYRQKIMIETLDETKEMIVSIDVQNEVVAKTTKAFNENKNLFFIALIFISLLVIIIFLASMKFPKHGNNVFLLILIIMLFIAMVFAGFIIINETNIYYKHPDDVVNNTINIRDVVGDNNLGGGYVVIEGNEKTPSAYQMVSFDDGGRTHYFSISQGEDVSVDVILSITDLIESGTYYYDVRVVMNGQNYVLERSFRVKV